MKIGEPEKYTVEDVVFLVSRKWGPRKVQQEALAALPKLPGDVADAMVFIERSNAIEDLTLNMLQQVVLSIENLVGEDDQLITEWSREVAMLLPESVCDELATRVMRYESDTRLGNPEMPEATELPPSTSTEGEQ